MSKGLTKLKKKCANCEQWVPHDEGSYRDYSRNFFEHIVDPIRRWICYSCQIFLNRGLT